MNMPPKLYICVLLHCYSNLHIDHTLLHVSSQKAKMKKMQLYLPFHCHICAMNKYAPEMPHIQISSCEDVRLWSVYIPHMNSMQSTV